MSNAPNRMLEPVGRRLRMLRMLSGESQARLAEMLGLTIQQMEDFENGTSGLSERQLQQLSAEVNVPLSFFFGHESDAGKMVHLNRP